MVNFTKPGFRLALTFIKQGLPKGPTYSQAVQRPTRQTFLTRAKAKEGKSNTSCLTSRQGHREGHTAPVIEDRAGRLPDGRHAPLTKKAGGQGAHGRSVKSRLILSEHCQLTLVVDKDSPGRA